MRRILIATDTWMPQINGVVTAIANIRGELESRGYTVVLIESGQFFSVPLRHALDVRVALFPFLSAGKLLRHAAPDAVHIMTEGPVGLAVRNACLRQGYSFTTSYHTHLDLDAAATFGSFLAPLVRWYLSWFHRKSSGIIVSTSRLRDDLKRIGFTATVVPLGVDTTLFTPTHVERDPRLERPVFTYMGRLAPEKNVEEFLSLNLPGSKLVIGDGPSRQNLEASYANALFVGMQEGKNLVSWLAQSDVFVMPSKTETFGLAIVEALACGIPIAAHDVMGPKDILTEGVDGVLSDDLGDAARKALSLSRDACRKTALGYSWAITADGFLSALVDARTPTSDISRIQTR